MTDEKKKRIGKFISLILRHNPQKIGLELDANGWADVNDLIRKSAKNRVSFTIEQLEEIVETNDKKRYSFNGDKTMIRANQGHSIDVDLALKPVTPPKILYHGTADRFCDSILKEGLKKKTRQHVHLSADKSTAIKVGSRHGRPYIFEVLAEEMFNDGVEFYCSENGVWLTDFVDSKYLSTIN